MTSGKIIINVGRQYGSGGKCVAEAIGQRLGIPVYDNELILKAAEQSGFNPELFRESDEKKRSFSLAGFFGMENDSPYFRKIGALGSGISDSDLFQIQSDAIREIASKGSAIFVGRASDYVLRDMDCLDVFVCAPLEARKKRISERMNVSVEEALKMIRKKDKGRKEYYDFFTFGDNWGQAANYDLCIDSSILGIDGTADFIISFLKVKG